MREFEQWLMEGSPDDIVVPNLDSAIQKYRSTMPKLYNIQKLYSDLRAQGIAYDIRMVDPMALKPGQLDFDLDKVRGMMDKMANLTLEAPLIISRDMHVVDGHHRWIAGANNNVPVMAHYVNMDFHDLIEFLNELQYPQNRHAE
jgi:hypothetical protein